MRNPRFNFLAAALLGFGLSLSACEGSAPGSEAGSGNESGGSVSSGDNEAMNSPAATDSTMMSTPADSTTQQP